MNCRPRNSRLKRHSALIFTSVSVAGVFATLILSIRAGMKAEQIISELKDVPESKKDRFLLYAKKTWKCYVIASLMALISAGSAVASHRISARDIARLATLATGSGAAFGKYREKIKEILGEEREKEIYEEVEAQSDWGVWPPVVDMTSPEYDVMNTRFRLVLGAEEVKPVEFVSNQIRVANALYNFQRNFVLSGYMNVADLKDMLGIEHETIDLQYFWIEDAYYICEMRPFVDLYIDNKSHEVDENGNKILIIRPRDDCSCPINDEEYKKLESGEYWDEWRYQVEKEESGNG